ncbi:Transposase DDE domain protein [Rubripirellula reticaptiva]|uniref:Transposase DDE domain protein n=1 Tax=Rubripirellula reticaptiva TaxID=2528013 RepID=A0A5C6EUB2_9BACT|nr:Transposase DDE domain protein [Rubripirellula reticaptiva]
MTSPPRRRSKPSVKVDPGAAPAKPPDLPSLQGMKYFAMLRPLLQRLHDHQTGRDKAANRTLFYDQYCMLVMLYVLNPTVSSLRALAQASELTKVQDKLGNRKATTGSLSEASGLFDSKELLPIIGSLAAQAQQGTIDPKIAEFAQQLIAVDGSVVSAMPSLITASVLKQTTGSGIVQWRLHTHFEVATGTPRSVTVTPSCGGEDGEKAVMGRSIESDKLYVMDRGYAKFRLFNAIVKQQSSYVCRLRDNSVYDILEDRPLTQGDHHAGVTSDQIVQLGKTSKKADRPDHSIRLVCVRCTPHKNRRGGKKMGSTAPDSDGVLRIATNLMNVPAEIIALIYLHRWTIEIFFRFYKQMMGGSHLISQSRNGIEIQVYCSIFACLLMNLWTGGNRISKRTFEMIHYYFIGLASEAELISHIEKVKAAAKAAAEKTSPSFTGSLPHKSVRGLMLRQSRSVAELDRGANAVAD